MDDGGAWLRLALAIRAFSVLKNTLGTSSLESALESSDGDFDGGVSGGVGELGGGGE